MKFSSLLVAAALVLGFGSQAYAQKRAGKRLARDAGFKTEGYRYGVAGCGLGSLVFDPGKGQVSAATTNGSFYSQIFGITFGTSNCNTGGGSASIEQSVFVEANLASLSKEAAQGDGGSLRAFAELLGCSDEFTAFARVGQEKYSQIFASPEAGSVVREYKKVIADTDVLQGTCVRAAQS